jgi:peptidoglycan/LPS O-acetylase OafA/YrhL
MKLILGAASVQNAHSGRDQIDCLTGLRFIAAMGVLVCHFSSLLGLWPSWQFVADLAGSFVFLFFVLSGFILTHQYDGRLSLPQQLRAYFRARFARIAPVYWLCLFVTLILFLVLGFELSLGGQLSIDDRYLSFALNLFAIQAWIPNAQIQQFWNAPGWSVSSEVFFYCLLPYLLRLKLLDGSIRTVAILWLAIAVTLLAYAIIIDSMIGFSAPEAVVWLAYFIRCPLFGLYCFLLGINLARTSASALSRIQALVCSTFLGLSLTTAYLIRNSGLGLTDLVLASSAAYYLVYAPTFYFVIILVRSEPPVIAHILGNRLMVTLGHSSYALYLIHWIALMYANGHADKSGPWSTFHLWSFILAQVISSVALFFLFENPMRRRLRYG